MAECCNSNTICLSREEFLAQTAAQRAAFKKELNQAAGPASVNRSSAGVNTTFRSAADLIALDRYSRSVAAGGCVIGECSLEFGDC